MTKKEVFNSWEISSNLNNVKDEIYEAVEYLEEKGLHKDAEQLMSYIYKIEAFQNKYER